MQQPLNTKKIKKHRLIKVFWFDTHIVFIRKDSHNRQIEKYYPINRERLYLANLLDNVVIRPNYMVYYHDKWGY